MKHTIYDIAKKANVSIATVSRCLNKASQHKVSSHTFKLVEAVIQNNKFAPHISARQLSKNFFKTIGVLLPSMKGLLLEEYYSKIIAGISDGLLDSDFQYKIILRKPFIENNDSYNFNRGEGIDGLIVLHWPLFFSSSYTFSNTTIPYILLNDFKIKPNTSSVHTDNFLGGYLAAQYLFENNHRKFAILTGPKWSEDSKQRLEGFTTYLHQKRIQIKKTNIICGHFSETYSYSQLNRIFPHHTFTALFCLNDAMAHGALKVLKKHNLKCPSDISIMGFDNHILSAHTQPPLTTINNPAYNLGLTATQQLLQEIKSKPSDKNSHTQTKLPIELIKRKSVKTI